MNNRMKSLILAFVLMVALLTLHLNYWIAGAITLAITLIYNAFSNMTKYKDRVELLQTACDPEAFLELTRKMKTESSLGNKMSEYLKIDEAVAHITLGKYEEAKAILLGIDAEKLPSKYNIKLIHKMNLMYAHYELGELEEAEHLYLDILPDLSVNEPQVVLTKEILLAERAYYLDLFDESKVAIEGLLGRELKKRTRLTLLYRLALMAEKEGDLKTAIAHFTEVAAQGNKLIIATVAKEKLAVLNASEPMMADENI